MMNPDNSQEQRVAYFLADTGIPSHYEDEDKEQSKVNQ